MSGDSVRSVLVFGPELAPRDTVELGEDAADAGSMSDIQASPGGGGVYVLITHANASSVVEIPLAGGDAAAVTDAVPPRASRLTITPRARQLLVLAEGALHFTDPRRRELDRTVRVCESAAVGAAVLRHADRAYVTCGEGSVAEINLRLRRPIRSSPLGACGPGTPALSLNETVLFVPCAETGALLYLDRMTLTPIDTVAVAPGIRDVMLSRKLNRAVVTGAVGIVALVEVRSRAVRFLEISGPLLDAALSGDGRSAYLLVSGNMPAGRSLQELDLATATQVASRPVPEWASGIATWPGERTPVMWWRK